MLRLLTASLLFLILTPINAQPLNPSWTGRWEGGDTALIVTPKNVINQGKICRWANKAPTGNFEGCLSHYAGGVKKSELMERFEAMQAAIKEQASSMDAAAKESAAKTVQALKTKLEQLSNDTFRILTTSDADYQGSGDCGAYYIMDKGVPYVVRQCESAGAEFALMIDPMQRATAPAALKAIDGRWYSPQWKYGYELKDGVGTATATNSAKFKVGDEIIYLSPKGKNTFEGEQIYQNGKFNPITATLLPDGKLQFKGDKNITWTMVRQ
jgi:hypothetical protein